MIRKVMILQQKVVEKVVFRRFVLERWAKDCRAWSVD